MISRRQLLIALGACSLTAPSSSFAQQQGKVWRIGYLIPGSASDTATRLDALRAGLRELGYVEGNNLVIELRAADGKVERLPGLAAELVALKVDLIVALGTTAIAGAQRASSTIPIVMGTASDPVSSGFVKTLARPGGNITGLSNLSADLSAKQLEMLHSVVPKLSSVCVLLNPANPISAVVLRSVQAAARIVGVKLLPLYARTPEEIGKAFSAMAQQKVGAVLVPLDGLLSKQRRQIAELATKGQLPSIFASSDSVDVGGLISYGQDLRENLHRAATFVDKIFKGAKPADLPVEQPTILELVVNMKTAKALGIKFPQAILVQATKVVE